MSRQVERFVVTLRAAFHDRTLTGGRLPSGSLAVEHQGVKATIDLETGCWIAETGEGCGWFPLAKFLRMDLDTAARLWGGPEALGGRVTDPKVPSRVRIPLSGGNAGTGEGGAGTGLFGADEGRGSALPRGDR